MASKPCKRWMCIAPDYNYGHESWDLFKEKLKELKPEVEIVGETFPKLMAPDYSANIEEILKAKPDGFGALFGGKMPSISFDRQSNSNSSTRLSSLFL